MEYKIISVESRKGGVGKTTAALNLSNLLVKEGYRTLLLDVDITGTSIEGSYSSAFWRENIYPVKQNKKEVNLLSIFNDLFLKGEGLPKFSFEEDNKNDFVISADKINIFNSEMFNDDSGLICDPRILFDELHSFWLIEMIESLCESFASCVKNAKTVIILDNSPGYVGLGKTIHEWITDIGPDRGKFLTISSLDVQDLNSCISAIQAIDNVMNKKIEGANYYSQLKKNISKIEEPSKEAKKFFLKLAANEVKSGKYQYFMKDTPMRPELSSYQSLIINKAPREIKSNPFYYDVNEALKGDVKIAILKMFSREQEDRTLQNIVYFDNYIHFQFVEPFIKRISSDRKQVYSSLKRSFTRVENEITENLHKEIEFDNYLQFLKTIDSYEKILSKLLVQLTEAGYYNIVRLIEEKWHPQTPLIKVQQIFENLCDDTPFLDKYSVRRGRIAEIVIDEEYFRNEMEVIFNNIENSAPKILNLYYIREKQTLLALCFFLAEFFLNQTHDNRKNTFFYSILILILILQSERFIKQKNNKKGNSFHFFLANENILSSEIRKYRSTFNEKAHIYFESKFPQEDIFYLFEELDMLSNLYNSFCHAQARLIDMHQDFKFLISVIRDVTIDERSERGIIFPNIRGILDEVIIKKTIPASQAYEKLHMEFQGAQYMSDFQEILKKNVISKWGL